MYLLFTFLGAFFFGLVEFFCFVLCVLGYLLLLLFYLVCFVWVFFCVVNEFVILPQHYEWGFIWRYQWRTTLIES